MAYTIYAWWKRPNPDAGGGAAHQQQWAQANTEDDAARVALSFVERPDGAHYATYWEEPRDDHDDD